jgi:hypothetical protein
MRQSVQRGNMGTTSNKRRAVYVWATLIFGLLGIYSLLALDLANEAPLRQSGIVARAREQNSAVFSARETQSTPRATARHALAAISSTEGPGYDVADVRSLEHSETQPSAAERFSARQELVDATYRGRAEQLLSLGIRAEHLEAEMRARYGDQRQNLVLDALSADDEAELNEALANAQTHWQPTEADRAVDSQTVELFHIEDVAP